MNQNIEAGFPSRLLVAGIVTGTPGHPDNKYASTTLKKGATFTIVPTSQGTYAYFDGQHTTLAGALVVSGSGGTATPTPSPSRSR